MKKALHFLVLLISQFSFSQNCNLISSATFNVPNNSQNVIQGSVLRMTNSTFTAIDEGQWNYIVWVKTTNNGGKIYKNGSLVFSGSFQNLNYVYNALDLGAENYTGYSGYFNGLIDEVRISNVERTSTEISNYYSSNQPFTQDNNTVGLWHFDENQGSIVNATAGVNGNVFNGTWAAGRFGNCINYNGTNTRTNFAMSIPTSNMTVEFWIKPNGMPTGTYVARPVSLYGLNTTSFLMSTVSAPVVYTWSTGVTGNSVTVNPTQLPYIWVTDGNCTDTIWFNSQSATIYDTITIFDTLYTTVTDTLIINSTVGLPGSTTQNTILMYPNPTSDFLIIDNGNYSIMSGYNISITSSSGQQVFYNVIDQQIFNIDLSTWNGNGLYHVNIIDPSGNIVEHRNIVLQ